MATDSWSLMVIGHSTQVEGMQDFLVTHHSHTWMAWNQTVNAAVVQFLKTGRFQPANLQSQGARAGWPW